MKKINIREQIMQLIYIIIAQFGVLFSVTETFRIRYNQVIVYICIVVLSLLLYALLQNKRYGKILFVGSLILSESILFFLKRKSLFKEVDNIGNLIKTHMKNYVERGEIIHLYEDQKFTVGLLCVLILVAGIITFTIVKTKRSLGVMVISLVIFCIPFMAGEEPNGKTLACIGIVLVTIGLSRGKGIAEADRHLVRCLGIGIGVLSVIIGSILFQTSIQKGVNYTKKYQANIIKFWKDRTSDIFKEKSGVGGVNGGELGKVDRLEDDDKIHLKITVEKKVKDRMYLQGFIGETYIENKWEEIKGYEDTGMIYSMLRNREEFSSSLDTIEIEYVDANKAYYYQPYGSSLYGGNRKEFGDKQILEYYPYDIVKAFPASDELKNFEEIYGNSYNDKYKRVSEKVVENFSKEVGKSIRGTNVDLVAEEIREVLRRQTEYSLHPGKTPKDKDFAKYFFFENRKGYCTHYATTATLFFRIKGIPSRYVSGYLVEPEEFKKQKDGKYTAVITGRNAHAWAEVYYSGGGWLPVETTPGYTRSKKSSMGKEQVHKKIETTTPKTNEKLPQTEENNKQKEKKKEEHKEKTPEMFQIIICILVCAGVFGSSGTIYLLQKKKRKKNPMLSNNEKIQQLFHQIYQNLLKKKKISGKEELNQEFLEKICYAYPAISRKNGEKMLDLVYRANYGKEQLKKEDYLLLKSILSILEKEK
ncbi:transglutaminase-like domain-containing protein [Faecalimonas sp.]